MQVRPSLVWRKFAMSRRRAPSVLIALAFTTLTLAPIGCVFNPKPDEQPPCTDCVQGPAKTPEELIQKLKDAYQARSFPEFAALLPTDDLAPYRFFLNEPLPGGETSWDRIVELRIHRRMFDPENLDPGEPPVPQELWLVDVSISLSLQNEFTERTDLYIENGGELDHDRWNAFEGQYHAVIFFDTQSDTDYRVDGRANFVVIEDKTKASGTAGKFLIYRWEDLGSFKPTVAAAAATPAVPAI
jgi:hypothetical protein